MTNLVNTPMLMNAYGFTWRKINQMQRCYLNGHGLKCSPKISREHFISRNILEFISKDGGNHVGGLPWQPKNTLQSVGINSLVQKNLCEIHNSGLTQLDLDIGKLFRRIHAINKNIMMTQLNALYKGSTVERWLLKVLCGSNPSNVGSTALNLLVNQDALWPVGWGLYISDQSGSQIVAKEFSYQALHHPSTQEIKGGKFTIGGLPFTLLLGRPDHPQGYGKYRPRGLIFNEGIFERRIEFGWPFEANEAIIYSKISSGNFVPDHHKGWNIST